MKLRTPALSAPLALCAAGLIGAGAQAQPAAFTLSSPDLASGTFDNKLEVADGAARAGLTVVRTC